ncbi:MAG: MerR family transcriptional regulator [Streptosporangiaceae bacterium]
MAELWTLDEQCERVAVALAHGYPGQLSARVREVPDRRTIRWYTQIGLVDRPATMRGRTALYGPRHLCQLVAIKRMQAEGHPLATIQHELAGATDATLERIARLPADAASAADAGLSGTPHSEPAGDPTATRPPTPSRTRCWAPAARHDEVEAAPATRAATSKSPKERAPASGSRPSAPVTESHLASHVALTYGVPLDGEVTLLLGGADHVPDRDDLDAIQRAAGPLIELLRRRGLTRPDDGRNPS